MANSAALIAPFIPLDTAEAIFADPRAWIAWGPPNRYGATAVTGGYRVTGEWHFASGRRQATWMGAHCQVTGTDGSLRLNRFGRPTTRTLLFRKEQTRAIEDWNTIGMRGTASEGYRVTDLFVPEAYSGTREDPSLRRDRGPLYAFTMQGLYAVGVSAVAFGIARAMLDEFIALVAEKMRRALQRLADSPVAGRCGSARGYFGSGAGVAGRDPASRAGADDTAPIDLAAVCACGLAVPTPSDQPSRSPIMF